MTFDKINKGKKIKHKSGQSMYFDKLTPVVSIGLLVIPLIRNGIFKKFLVDRCYHQCLSICRGWAMLIQIIIRSIYNFVLTGFYFL